jgi:hypothetical protein
MLGPRFLQRHVRTFSLLVLAAGILAGCERWWAHNLTFGPSNADAQLPTLRTSLEILRAVDELAAKQGFKRIGQCGNGGYAYSLVVKDCGLLACHDRQIEMWAAPTGSAAVAVRLFEFVSPSMDPPDAIQKFEVEMVQTIETRFGAGTLMTRLSDNELGSAGICNASRQS